MSDRIASSQTTPKRVPGVAPFLLAPTPAKASQPIKVNKPTPARRKVDLSDEKISHSCPPDLFRPPPKPRPGPMTAEYEPPPIELPPSPPIFAPFSYSHDVDADINGRSLNEFRWSFSMPNSYMPQRVHSSSFHDILEKPEDEVGVARHPISSSYSESSDRPTIFNLMQDTTSPIPATSTRSWKAVNTATKSQAAYHNGNDFENDSSPSVERRAPRQRAETGEELQFDLTLDSDVPRDPKDYLDKESWTDDGSTIDDGRASFGLQY